MPPDSSLGSAIGGNHPQFQPMWDKTVVSDAAVSPLSESTVRCRNFGFCSRRPLDFDV
jgi:hypothetical protein